MRIAGQGFQVAHPEVAAARLEKVPEGECRQRGIAAGASTGNHRPGRVDIPAIGQPASAVDAVIHVYLAPLEVQPLPVLAPETGAAGVLDVEKGDAAAGPILGSRIQGACGGASRCTVTPYD